MIKLLNIKDLEPFKEGLNAVKLFKDENLELIHITLSLKERIPNHENNIDVVFYVLSGKALVVVNNEKQYVEKGDCFEIKKDLTRSWENIGDSPLCIMAIKKM